MEEDKDMVDIGGGQEEESPADLSVDAQQNGQNPDEDEDMATENPAVAQSGSGDDDDGMGNKGTVYANGEGHGTNNKLSTTPQPENSWLETINPDGSTIEEETVAFMSELEDFYRERSMEFKPPKFYGEPLDLLKLWRAVVQLGGYERVTAAKLWRQVGEAFNPPKTCTTISWTFRIFYEKALFEYEKHKREIGVIDRDETTIPDLTMGDSEQISRTPVLGRGKRDSAARAVQGWHTQHDGVGEEKNSNYAAKREKNFKSIGSLKQKKPATMQHTQSPMLVDGDKQLDASIVDLGPPADWVKISVRETRDGFEVYALVPGLLREEVRVQSDPAGRLVITGQPEQLDNPWGITPFKKVVNLPARIDPLQTSAVVSLHGRLFVRVPFEQ